MGKEQEKRPTPSRSQWNRSLGIALCLVGLGAGAGVGVAAYHGLLEQKPAIEKEVQNWKLVPTYTPTPEIEITPTPEPAATPIPKIVIILNAPEIEPAVKAEVFLGLSQQYPEVWQELPSRAENAMAYVEKINQIGPDFSAQKTKLIEFSNFSAFKDFKIFEKYGMGEGNLSLTKENLLYILAWYELEYAQPIEQNPNYQRAVRELAPALRVVNEIMKDKLSPEEFRREKIPQIPENLQGRLMFGNDNRGHRFFPEIFATAWKEDLFKNPNPENYQPLLKYLTIVASHELIHAWPQALYKGQGSSWDHEKDYEIKRGDTLWCIAQEEDLKVGDILEENPQIQDPDLIFPGQLVMIPQKGESIWPENRKYHLAHMSMCSLTALAQEKLGFEPGIEPRIIYIYSRLKKYGVEDPYGLIVQAGATFNGDKLWETYEGVRKEGDLSLDELIATNNPNPDFDYYAPEEREAFRAEYASYLSSPAFGIGVSSEVKTAPKYIESVEGEKITHWVSPRDTLEYLSAKYETPITQIMTENNLTSEELEEGQKLVITTDIIHILQPGETFEGLAEKYGVSLPLLAATNRISYWGTESFDFINPGYKVMIPRSEEELTLKGIVSIRASDEWDEETQEMINKMGEEIIYLLDRMRVFNGFEIIDKGEILVYPRELVGLKGLWVSRERGESKNVPWGIYIPPDKVLAGKNHGMATIAHEFGHNCNDIHAVAFNAEFGVSRYQDWISKESILPN